MNWSAKLRQPTTINGLGALAATLVAGAIYYVNRDSAQAGVAAGLMFSLLHIAIDDNSALPSDVEKLAIDAATAVATKKLTDAIPALFADASAVVKDVAGIAAPKP